MHGDSVLYTFEWPSGASKVVVTGTFDNWSQSTQLTKLDPDSKFMATISLPKYEKALFKYVVDGQWITSSKHAVEIDFAGIQNNVVYPEELSKFTNPDDTENDKENENPSYKDNSNKTAENKLAEVVEKISPSERKNYSETYSLSSNETLDTASIGRAPIRKESKYDVGDRSEKSQSAENTLKLLTQGERELKEKSPDLDESDKKQITRSNSEYSMVTSIPSNKKNAEKSLQSCNVAIDNQSHFCAQKSNTESSVFTSIEPPIHLGNKEVGNGMKEIVGDHTPCDDQGMILNSLHLDDLGLSASIKSISSNEIFSSTHGSLSHFNMNGSSENIESNNDLSHFDEAFMSTIEHDHPTPSRSIGHRQLWSSSIVSRVKKIFR